SVHLPVRSPSLWLASHLSSAFSMIASAAPPARHSFPTRRSSDLANALAQMAQLTGDASLELRAERLTLRRWRPARRCRVPEPIRSEEHTSELQSRCELVCRLLLVQKKELYQKQLRLLRQVALTRT